MLLQSSAFLHTPAINRRRSSTPDKHSRTEADGARSALLIPGAALCPATLEYIDARGGVL